MSADQSTSILSEQKSGPGNRSGKDRLADKFLPLYERLFGEESDFAARVNRKLRQAKRNEPVETFLSLALGYGAITGGFLWLVVSLLAWMIFFIVGVNVPDLANTGIRFSPAMVELWKTIRVPLFVIIIGIVFGTIGFIGGFFAPVIGIYLNSGERKREINALLPHAVSYMYALSIGGMNQLDILEVVAQADDTYGEVSEEFDVILKETKYFGIDYQTAIRNRALETPSNEFGQFLTDFLSVLSSGGDMEKFLREQKDKFIRSSTQQQEQELETLELFGEMYMTLSLFPLLLIILLVILTMIGGPKDLMMLGTIYLMIPMTGLVFLVLISTVKQDDPGDGYLVPEGDDPYIQSDTGALGVGVIDQFTAPYSILTQIRNQEGTFKAKQILKRPNKLFEEKPVFTFAITIPISLIVIIYAAVTGIAPTTFEGLKKFSVWGTFIYLYFPMYMMAIPYAFFYELRERARKSITVNLSDNLRKLASANDTGQTLLKSFKTVAETSGGTLSNEFGVIYNKVQYGTSMKQALIEFNNKYHQPRLARRIKLISRAQETSSQISPVLKTAAESSEEQDRLAAERKTRTRMQVVIIMMTYFTLLAVMVILRVKFLGPMAELSGSGGGGGGGAPTGGPSFGGNVDVAKLSLYFFHAVTIQAITGSFIAGYLRTSKVQAGIKFLLILPTSALLAWALLV